MTAPIPVQPPPDLAGPIGEPDIVPGVGVAGQTSFFTAWQRYSNRIGKLNPQLLQQAGKAHASLNNLMRSR